MSTHLSTKTTKLKPLETLCQNPHPDGSEVVNRKKYLKGFNSLTAALTDYANAILRAGGATARGAEASIAIRLSIRRGDNGALDWAGNTLAYSLAWGQHLDAYAAAHRLSPEQVEAYRSAVRSYSSDHDMVWKAHALHLVGEDPSLAKEADAVKKAVANGGKIPPLTLRALKKDAAKQVGTDGKTRLNGFKPDQVRNTFGLNGHARALLNRRGSQRKGDPEAVPPLPSKPRSKLGEVYELGEHRLYCGTALDAFDGPYSTLKLDGVIADPPYGTNLITDYSNYGPNKPMMPESRGKKYDRVVGDDRPFDARPYVKRFADESEQFWFGADYYRRTLSDDDRDGSWLVWDKRNESSDGGLGSGFELIWSKTRHKRDLLRFYFFGAFGVEGANRMHPTQKPTPLLAEIINRWMPENGVVADPFSGSGSVLIACEQTGRVCLAAEVEPRYCDVIRRRYAEFVDRPDLAP